MNKTREPISKNRGHLHVPKDIYKMGGTRLLSAEALSTGTTENVFYPSLYMAWHIVGIQYIFVGWKKLLFWLRV